MTIVRGVRIVFASCCGAKYATPRYASMNFMAFEYWTDGWREGSLMPNDEGLRRCNCRKFVLMRDLVEVEAAETSDLPHIEHVPDELLPECIANAHSEDMEVAARLEYWRHLNHTYRQKYREHREAEEAATKAQWEAANPDRRTWWDKLRRRERPIYSRSPDSPFTYPLYEPTDVQLQNMRRLSKILLAWGSVSRPTYDALTLAELYREQGRFDEAQVIMLTLVEDEEDVTRSLIAKLIKDKQSAPMRYRI